MCARLVVCACACRSVFIIDHGRVEATEKEADERRKRREDVRRHSKGESGARRRDECTRHGEGFWKRRRRKDPRRCCCENAGEEEDGDETVSDGGRDDELCSGRYDDDDDDSRRRSAFYRGGDFRGRGSRRLDAFDRFARIEGTSAVVGVVVVFVAEVVLQIGVGRLGGCLGRSWR